jgi:molybdate transport system substrate-binding protein
VAAALLVATLTACGAGTPETRTLNVFAAASLTGTFGELETRFEADNPDVDVRLNLAGSSDLAQQIVNGAPADVFAAANDSTMRTVSDAGLVQGEPALFATNVLQIVTAPGNPEGITGFADLARPGVDVVVCAPQVPCGAATERIEQATGVTLSPVSEEPDVRSVLSRVQTGNADAGLVYVTDVRSAGDAVQGVDFPESSQAVNGYPIAAMTSAQQPELASSFIELVTGDFGAKILRDAGFGTP